MDVSRLKLALQGGEDVNSTKEATVSRPVSYWPSGGRLRSAPLSTLVPWSSVSNSMIWIIKAPGCWF